MSWQQFTLDDQSSSERVGRARAPTKAVRKFVTARVTSIVGRSAPKLAILEEFRQRDIVFWKHSSQHAGRYSSRYIYMLMSSWAELVATQADASRKIPFDLETRDLNEPNSVELPRNAILKLRTGQARLISFSTIAYVREGLKCLGEEEDVLTPHNVNIERYVQSETVSDDRIEAFITKQLGLMFTTISDLAGQVGKKNLQLADHNGFKDFVDLNLQQRLRVRPKQFAEFSNRLWLDMVSFLACGGTYSGSWGRIEQSESGLVLRVASEPLVLPEIRTRPKVLE